MRQWPEMECRQQQKLVEGKEMVWRLALMLRRGYAELRWESTVRSLQTLDALNRENRYMGER
jgi:hypothetical protein